MCHQLAHNLLRTTSQSDRRDSVPYGTRHPQSKRLQAVRKPPIKNSSVNTDCNSRPTHPNINRTTYVLYDDKTGGVIILDNFPEKTKSSPLSQNHTRNHTKRRIRRKHTRYQVYGMNLMAGDVAIQQEPRSSVKLGSVPEHVTSASIDTIALLEVSAAEAGAHSPRWSL